MANVPNPPITPRTGLWGLGFRFEIMSLRMARLSDDLYDVWLIGKWLCQPFSLISVYLNNARDKSWQADSELVDAKNWIKGLIEGWTIIHVLEQLWWEFRYLRTDPRGWVAAKIDQISSELRYIRLDTYGWLRTRLYWAFPVFYNLLGNSGWWVYNELDKRYPDIGSFIRDSWGYIYNKVLGIFQWARDLQNNPSNTVIGWINNRTGWFWDFITNPYGTIYTFMSNINVDFRLLINNPVEWFKSKLSDSLGMSRYELNNLPVSLVRRMFSVILNNQDGLLDYTKEAIINLVLRFI